MTQPATTAARYSPWPHRWAVALVSVTFPLIWVGGLVTTYDAGMAVPDWPTTYGYNLFLYPWQTWIAGPWDLFVEHGHRLLGALAGLLTLALCASLWLAEPRAWTRWLGVAAVFLVIAQGLLGGLRVIQDEQQLAKIHGCVGPAFFALCVSLSVVTSGRWQQGGLPGVHVGSRRLQGLSLTSTFFAYLQIVLGAHVRHLPAGTSLDTFRIAVTFHLIMALMLVGSAVALAFRAQRVAADVPSVTVMAWVLLAVLGGQIILGSATWVTNYGWPAWFSGFDWAAGYVVSAAGRVQSMTTTAHVATGSLILGLSTCVALRSFRLLRDQPSCGIVGPLAIEVGR